MRSSHPDVLESVVGKRTLLALVTIMGALTIGVFALVGVLAFGRFFERGAAFGPQSAHAAALAVRDLARVETTELHIEKAIDLTDKQSRLAGLVGAEDAVLIVVSGDVTIGVDLAKLKDDDVEMDERASVAHVRLPCPEILDVRLDEKATYVVARTGTSFAERGERIIPRARAEVIATIERAARETDAVERAKHGAERQVRVLLSRLGIERVSVVWRT